ncbi:inactive dipeptidyl peptidase 10 isoform X2 [Cimex lectularius]|uniref:Inactive dipeptidyl peptidase 10 n=1 Tax=Cimex lectularius TaxID=79782 RepID=A0A8I6RUK3_CIMLE|nr:inactive dipeptidyl peptidase 10 isoform X2 [Cimex lectularius]
MHAAIERNSWRLPPEDIVQVADPRTKKAQELVISEQDEGRNWMSVILSLLVIGGVVSGIVTAIYTLGYVDELLYWSGRRMVLQEALRPDLKPWRVKPSWASSQNFMFHADDGGLSVYSTTTDNITRLVSNHTITQLNAKWFQATQDLMYVLLRHNVKKVFKNTFLAYYTIYDVKNDHLIPVRLKGVPKVQQSKLRAALWCGNTSRLILVGEDNNIYFMSSPIDQSADYQITDTGEDGIFYNGLPDWLYQEEIFEGETASLWCSEDGSVLLYASYNDSAVRTFKYPSLDSAKSGGDFPSTGSLPYPTPGTANPAVELWLVDLNSTDKPQVLIEPPQVFQHKEYYLTSAGWVNHRNEEIVTVWLNRPQNLSLVSICKSPDWKCAETHAERAPENGWVSIKGHPVFSEDGGSFLLMSRIQEGETGKFTHIKEVTLSEEQRISVISHGKYQVTSILAWDYVNNVVYYLGTDGEKAGQRHLYVVKNPKNGRAPLSKATPMCVTCDHSTHRYDNCSYFNAYLPPPPYTKGISRYIVECLGPGLPLAGVHTWFNHTILIEKLYTTRPKYGPKLSTLALPLQRTFHVPLPHGQGKATAQLLLPPSWREELRDAAFPVLVEVNGKPGAPLVSEMFSIDWGTYMSSQFDVVYIKMDVIDEGSNFVNMRFAGVQIQDYITVIRYLIDTLKFLDRERVAVWGRGYGGYVTSMILSSQHHIVKCGIAISPITDWLYYNSAFTERLLGQPSETFKEYVENDAIQRSRHIEAGSLFLIHGLADISVPYVHSLSLAKALTQQGILFRYQSYGDEGHELSGVLEHSYMSMENFLSTCLSLDKNEQVGL